MRYDDLVVACSDLPDEAKEGLIAVLKQCKQHPKAMQGEADVVCFYYYELVGKFLIRGLCQLH